MEKMKFFLMPVFALICLIFMYGCFEYSDSKWMNLASDSFSKDIPIRYGYYLSTNLWPNTTLSVCWENPTDANFQYRQLARNAVEGSWAYYSNIKFTGWGACDSSPSNIRIKINDEQPHTIGLGVDLNNHSNGMVLNFTYENWGCTIDDTDDGQQVPCSTKSWFNEARRNNWIFSNAIHEFGHALGIAHEHNRDDSAWDCHNAPQGTNGDTKVGEFDADSIMNYCYNATYNGKLSYGDIKTIQQMYDNDQLNYPILLVTHENKILGQPDAEGTTEMNFFVLTDFFNGYTNTDTKTIKIENVGGESINFTNTPPVTHNDVTGRFHILNQPPSVLYPGSFEMVDISFSTTVVYSYSATISIPIVGDSTFNFRIKGYAPNTDMYSEDRSIEPVKNLELIAVTGSIANADSDGKMYVQFFNQSGVPVLSGGNLGQWITTPFNDLEKNRADRFQIVVPENTYIPIESLYRMKIETASTDGWNIKGLIVLVNNKYVIYSNMNVNQWLDSPSLKTFEVIIPDNIESQNYGTLKLPLDSHVDTATIITTTYDEANDETNKMIYLNVNNTNLALDTTFNDRGRGRTDIFFNVPISGYMGSWNKIQLYNPSTDDWAVQTLIIIVNDQVVYYKDLINRRIGDNGGYTWTDYNFRNNQEWFTYIY